MSDGFIRVYDTRTGKKVPDLVPRHFLKLFPYLTETPSTKDAAKVAVQEPAKPASNVKETK